MELLLDKCSLSVTIALHDEIIARFLLKTLAYINCSCRGALHPMTKTPVVTEGAKQTVLGCGRKNTRAQIVIAIHPTTS